MPATLTSDEPPALRIVPETGEAEEDVSDELTVTGHCAEKQMPFVD